MRHEIETEVLVTGAGPAGLLTALLLADNGVRVKIIDKEDRAAAHAYACAVHPRSLGILHRAGLAGDLLGLGRRIETVGLFDKSGHRQELRLDTLDEEYPFMLVLAQSTLESVLEEALQRRHGIGVDWQHRLTSLEPNNAHVVAQVDKLGYEGKGYIVPSFEEAVEKTLTASADFLVGADGAQSAVRNALGIAYEPVNKAERFRVFELEVKGDVPKEFQLVLDGKSISAYWPLPGANCRWTFQIDCREDPDETHDKERTALWLDEPARNRSNREILRQLIEARAPWFKTDINEINWTTEVQFQGCLAKRFGQGRCWLVGDSAHQTSPAGMQSMNVGLAEAEALAQSLTGILRKGAALGSLETYGLESRNAWEKLLGRSGKLQRPGVSKKGSASVPEARLLSSLPASGDHLVALLKQMNAELAPA